jgi:predicted cupin superfamily sugar epimerase
MNIEKPADYWIEKLNLTIHPEGGYFAETYRSRELFDELHLPDRYLGDRPFSTAIYFLVKSNQYSAFHRLLSDEIWHFFTGSSLTLHLIMRNGEYRSMKLGRELEKNESFQIVVPALTWMAASVNQPDSFSLMGCTVSPGFEFSDFELADQKKLILEFPQHREIIKKFTK